MSFAIVSGVVVGAYLSTTLPFLSKRNFVKFHLLNEKLENCVCEKKRRGEKRRRKRMDG